jgi:glycosyltransferase involved in cell wall biosynthesis
MYTPGSFPSAVWDRFLDHFDHVHVIARDGGFVADCASFARADRDRVSFQFLSDLASFRQLVRTSSELREQMRSAVMSADAVVARLPSEIGMLAVKHARRLGKPYAVEVVGCAWDSYWNHGASLARLYAPLAFFRARRTIAKAPLALYVTSAWLQGRYPPGGQTGVASNVSLPEIDSITLRHRDARLAALASGKTPVLGTIASLRVRYKGVQTALQSLATLRSSGLELNYRILGAGAVEPWQQLAQKLGILDLVHFDGTRSAGEEVGRWLDDIDIYLQPSFQEGLPRALIEAMSRGAACIGSTCGGIPELLPPERLHEPGDAEALARRVLQLASNPTALAEASAADLETARQFDPELLKKRRSEFYARLRIEAEKLRSSR